MIPIIATTISNSISEKPFSFFIFLSISLKLNNHHCRKVIAQRLKHCGDALTKAKLVPDAFGLQGSFVKVVNKWDATLFGL
jgi:hypothetical protein